MPEPVLRTTVAIISLLAIANRSIAAQFDRVIDLNAGIVVGDDFWVPFPDIIFSLGQSHTFNLTLPDDKRLRVAVGASNNDFQLGLRSSGAFNNLFPAGGVLVAPYIGDVVVTLRSGEANVGVAPSPIAAPPGPTGIPVVVDFDSETNLDPPTNVVEFDSIKFDWMPAAPHPNSGVANFLTISTTGGAVSIEDGDQEPTAADLYWSGAAGTSLYAVAANWSVNSTSSPSPHAPRAIDDLMLDDRLNGGPPADTFTYTPIQLDGAVTNEARIKGPRSRECNRWIDGRLAYSGRDNSRPNVRRC
jgi:hypothetical protein